MIPLKTLRYRSGVDRVWGFDMTRNIRRKNEQAFLAPVPRGYDIYRVSLAAKLKGLDLPGRRDLKAIPFVTGSVDRDYLRPGEEADRRADIGLDVKWGITPNLTADFTVNTDFAQVAADEEQIDLTRFPLFLPEKRPFFLENASIFQFGTPQEIDLFFSRRIGRSCSTTARPRRSPPTSARRSWIAVGRVCFSSTTIAATRRASRRPRYSAARLS